MSVAYAVVGVIIKSASLKTSSWCCMQRHLQRNQFTFSPSLTESLNASLIAQQEKLTNLDGKWHISDSVSVCSITSITKKFPLLGLQ